VHRTVQDVDLELAKFDNGRKRHRIAIGPPHEGDDPRQQLLGRKRDGQNVVCARLEGRQLGLQVAAPGQTDDGQAHPTDRCNSKQCHDLRTVQVHVEDRQMRLPLGEGRSYFAGARSRPSRVDAMIEGHLDELD